jgi:hypothetical protein
MDGYCNKVGCRLSMYMVSPSKPAVVLTVDQEDTVCPWLHEAYNGGKSIASPKRS